VIVPFARESRESCDAHGACAGREHSKRAENGASSEGKTRILRGKTPQIPYCAPDSGLYLAPRRTAFLSQSENLFTIPGEKHGREKGC
jgi:hypothetical protein